MLDKLKRIMEYLALDDSDDEEEEILEIETDIKTEKRHSFLGGLCTGALISLVIVVVSGAVSDF